jgi:hypothetical protein
MLKHTPPVRGMSDIGLTALAETPPLTPRVRGVSDIGLTGRSETPPLTSHTKGRAERDALTHASCAKGVRRILNGWV